MSFRWAWIPLLAACSPKDEPSESVDSDVLVADPYAPFQSCVATTDNDPADQYTYSEAGDLLTRERDNGGWTVSETYTWREDHQPLTSMIIRNNGTTEMTYTYDGDALSYVEGNSEGYYWEEEYTYDETGRVISSHYSFGESASSLDLISTATYVYNDDGTLRTRISDNLYDIDDQVLYTWENGLLVKEGRYLFDQWQPEFLTTYAYDDAGWMIESTSDYGGDGVIDRLQTWVRDDLGRTITRSTDRDGDGEFDTVINTVWDCPE